jgi:hypothetical protein
MTDIEPRTARTVIAGRDYEGPGSLAGAVHDRQAMATAVEAAKRARVDAREWLWTAREAERTLGRMIVAARQAGDLADEGRPAQGETMQTLHSLGVEPHLAAHAVRLAEVPAEVWAIWHDDPRDPTQAALAGAVRDWRETIDRQEGDREARERQRQQIENEISTARKRLRDLANSPATVVPPLADDEVSRLGFDVFIGAALGDDPPELPKRRDATAKAQDRLILRMDAFAAEVSHHDPIIETGEWRDASVLAARAAVQRLTSALAVWLRQLNALYTEGVPDE